MYITHVVNLLEVPCTHTRIIYKTLITHVQYHHRKLFWKPARLDSDIRQTSPAWLDSRAPACCLEGIWSQGLHRKATMSGIQSPPHTLFVGIN